MINAVKTIWQEHQEEKERISNLMKQRNWEGELENVITNLVATNDPVLSILRLQGRIDIITGSCKDIPQRYYFKPHDTVLALVRNMFSDTFIMVTVTHENAKYIMQHELHELCKDFL